MIRLARTVALLAISLGGLTASASETVYLALGETKIINISQGLKGAQAENTALLNVKRKSHGAVSIEGKALGVTPVTLRTRDGNEFELLVQVIPAGSSVYELDRDSASRRGQASAVRRTGDGEAALASAGE